MRGRRTRATWLWTLAAVVLASVVVLLWIAGPAETGASAATAPERQAGPAVAIAGAPPATLAGAPVARARWWKPGMEHDYGDDPDPFVRQPLDYDSDTPRILGDRISYHVYDLERVQDMVRRGDQPGSEIAQVRGQPLGAGERQAARELLQAFFDATVPEVDDLIAGSMTRDEGYALIGARRLALDRDLQAALGLSDKQLDALWPHIGDRNRIRDQLRD